MRFSERLTGENAVLTGNFLILLITWVLMNSTQPIAGTFSSKYFVSLGATPLILSMMFFVSSLAIAFVQFPGGYLADQNGRKWLVAVMTFGLSFGYLFLVFAPLAVDCSGLGHPKPMPHLSACAAGYDD